MATASHQQTTTPDGLEYALLGLLRREPLHAYEMYQRLRRGELLGHIWQLKQSHLYALLARLEEQGLIAGSTALQGARPPRRMLALTAEGTASLYLLGDDASAAWARLPAGVSGEARLRRQRGASRCRGAHRGAARHLRRLAGRPPRAHRRDFRLAAV